jgi:gamma-glutamyl-gamma-aminobutyraldehyde dehydrogenase
VSPIDGRVLAKVADCGEADVNAAVAAARRAFDAGVWAGLNPRARKAVLLRWAALMRTHLDELALLETLDAGKPIGDTTTVDVPGAAYCVEWFAEAIDKVGGEVAPADHHLVGLVTREPVGVVAAVVPWNFPILMAAWKFGPALAAGNSVVLKPSEKSPLTAIRVAQLAYEAGIPAGVFNVVPGAGEPGKLLALHRDVDCIAFTGSTAVGKLIMQYAAQSNLKRAWLELGGKSPNIVLPDCPISSAPRRRRGRDLLQHGRDVHGRLAPARASRHQGRVHREAGRGRACVRAGQSARSVGVDGRDRRRHPARACARLHRSGRSEGTLVTGGARVRQETGGFYVEPTVFEVKPDAKIAREEIFGPVLSVIVFDDVDEAVRIANDTEYGLAAAVWTSDLTTAHDVSRGCARARCG